MPISTVFPLLKDEAFTIMGAWFKKVYDNWTDMTPYHMLKSLIETLRDNPRLRNLFHNVVQQPV